MKTIIRGQLVDVNIENERKLFGLFKQSLVSYTYHLHRENNSIITKTMAKWISNSKLLK